MSNRFTRRSLLTLAALSAVGIAGFAVSAAQMAATLAVSITWCQPPTRPNRPVISPKLMNLTTPNYTAAIPPAPSINNSYSFAQIGSNGIRVDAYWRPLGTSTWQYYGSQTSGNQGTWGVAKFNPFYLPSGPAELRFVATGFNDRILSVTVPE